MEKHGIEIRRQWEYVIRKLKREEAKAESAQNEGTTYKKHCPSGKRKRNNNYGQLTGDMLKRMNKKSRWDLETDNATSEQDQLPISI